MFGFVGLIDFRCDMLLLALLVFLRGFGFWVRLVCLSAVLGFQVGLGFGLIVFGFGGFGGWLGGLGFGFWCFPR